MMDGDNAAEDDVDNGDGNGGRQWQWKLRRWTTKGVMADGNSDSEGKGNGMDGRRRRCGRRQWRNGQRRW